MAVLPIFQAFLARILFFVHSFVAIWRCADVLGDPKLWLLSLANVALVVETLITCCKRKGHEWKWFSPAIFIFLLASVPPIWFLELDRLDQYRNSVSLVNITTTTIEESLSSIQGITIPIKLSPSLWVTVIEQMLLLFLIVGRWIMPKGEISRDALSQLLFVYIGMSSDIMELFVLFEEEQVLGNPYLSYAILAVWSASLLQFCMVLTATKNPKRSRLASQTPEKGLRQDGFCIRFCTTEAWGIFATMFLQDGPFLVIRLFVMFQYYIITYNTIFFTCKNILVLMLLVYRMLVVCTRKTELLDEYPSAAGIRNHENGKNKIDVERNPSPDSISRPIDVDKRLPLQRPSKFNIPL